MLKLLVASVAQRRNVPSFFQSVKAMAAILRANVSRAISGFIPFASKATQKSRNGPTPQLARVAAPLKISLSSRGCDSDRDHESVAVFSSVAVLRVGSDIAHCRGSQCPAHYRSRVAVCSGTGAASASTQSSGRLGSDRCRESGAAVSRLYVSGSPPITQDAGFVVTSAIHPTADRAARLADARLRARSCVTIPRDNAEHRPGYPHKGCSSRDTEL